MVQDVDTVAGITTWRTIALLSRGIKVVSKMREFFLETRVDSLGMADKTFLVDRVGVLFVVVGTIQAVHG